MMNVSILSLLMDLHTWMTFPIFPLLPQHVWKLTHVNVLALEPNPKSYQGVSSTVSQGSCLQYSWLSIGYIMCICIQIARQQFAWSKMNWDIAKSNRTCMGAYTCGSKSNATFVETMVGAELLPKLKPMYSSMTTWTKVKNGMHGEMLFWQNSERSHYDTS